MYVQLTFSNPKTSSMHRFLSLRSLTYLVRSLWFQLRHLWLTEFEEA